MSACSSPLDTQASNNLIHFFPNRGGLWYPSDLNSTKSQQHYHQQIALKGEMDQQKPVECILDVFTDPRSVRDVIKGILHTIFFNRFFPSLAPETHDVLDLTLPYVNDDELETMIEQRACAFERQLDAERSTSGGNVSSDGGSGGRGQIAVQFFEKKRRKAWLRADEEVCWECWTIKVTVAEPKTDNERAKVRRAMEQTLSTTVMKIVTFVNTNKDHIPPITTQGSNPFPYKINFESKETSWVSRMRLY